MQTRHDPYHYLPHFLRLEAKVANRSTGKLRDFVRAMSGGATPKAEEYEKYYADSETGIPFVRVQNLSVSGQLQLDDVKYINEETHSGMLARSQVQADDLLVKITGVGRMAVASVPPTGFEGNINQHIARIRTDSRHTSEVLAAWLNTDVAESLAKRRSTGGTRPALDFGALRSIPVIFDERIHSLMLAAHEQYQSALAKANQILESIDIYLSEELGIPLLNTPPDTIASRMFKAKWKDISSMRIDPARYTVHHQKLRAIVEHGKFPSRALRYCINHSVSGDWGFGETELNEDLADYKKCLVLRNTEFDNQYNLEINEQRVAYRYIKQDKLERLDVQPFDILVEKSGGSPDQPVGRVAYLDEKTLKNRHIGFSNFLVKIRANSDVISPSFLYIWLKSSHRRRITESMQAQTNGIRNLIMKEYLAQSIPTPEMPIQIRIADTVLELMRQSQTLRSVAKHELRSERARIEGLLFGGSA